MECRTESSQKRVKKRSIESMKGHIQKRGKNSHRIKFDKGKDPATGRRLTEFITVHGTKREAEAELARRLHEVNAGAFVEPSRVTVPEFLDRWLTIYAEGNVGAKTFERYQGIIEHHFKPAFRSLPLQKLTPLHIQAHYAASLKGGRKDGREGGLSTQTVLHHHRVLSEALGAAVQWQLLVRNPCDAVQPPAVRPKEAAVIDETQIAWLIEASQGTRLYIPIVLAVSAGLRRGEILAATWSNLDPNQARLRITRSVEQTKGHITFKEPKGKRSRNVILPSFVLEALDVHKKAQDEIRKSLGPDYRDGDLICPCPDGSLWTPSAFTSSYRDLLRRRDLAGPNFHALRHSHASLCLRNGVDLKEVGDRLGHSRASFTLDTYVHLLPGQDQEVARRVDSVLRKAIEKTRQPNLI
jgi:integrase